MRRSPLLIALGAAVVLVVAFLLLRPDGEEAAADAPPAATQPAETSPETTPAETETEETDTEPPAPAEPVGTRIVVTVRDGRPEGGIQRASARAGDPILLVVRSDVDDHVHVHGYDLFGDVGPGRPARMQFRADLTGRFEIELEDRHQQIAQLTVLP